MRRLSESDLTSVEGLGADVVQVRRGGGLAAHHGRTGTTRKHVEDPPVHRRLPAGGGSAGYSLTMRARSIALSPCRQISVTSAKPAARSADSWNSSGRPGSG